MGTVSAPVLDDILRLSVAERLQIAEGIWESIVSEPEQLPLSEPQIAELDQRLEEYHRNPQRGASWQEVKERIRNRTQDG